MPKLKESTRFSSPIALTRGAYSDHSRAATPFTKGGFTASPLAIGSRLRLRCVFFRKDPRTFKSAVAVLGRPVLMVKISNMNYVEMHKTGLRRSRPGDPQRFDPPPMCL
jgi:hypothetical protein